jgi:hypothetical protein
MMPPRQFKESSVLRRLPIPASPEFDRFAQGAQFRDRIAVVVKASPDVIFQALREVALRDMKLAWALGRDPVSTLPTGRAHAGSRFDPAVPVFAN